MKEELMYIQFNNYRITTFRNVSKAEKGSSIRMYGVSQKILGPVISNTLGSQYFPFVTTITVNETIYYQLRNESNTILFTTDEEGMVALFTPSGVLAGIDAETKA
jgi:hypothetical protein